MFAAIYCQHYQEPDIGNPKALINPPSLGTVRPLTFHMCEISWSLIIRTKMVKGGGGYHMQGLVLGFCPDD